MPSVNLMLIETYFINDFFEKSLYKNSINFKNTFTKIHSKNPINFKNTFKKSFVKNSFN